MIAAEGENLFSPSAGSFHLAAGRTCLEAWFGPENLQKPWPAVSVAVKRLGPADPKEIKSYRASDPDSLLR